MSNDYWNRPCAAKGLLSYRYKGSFGWIMIGARDDKDALREARRSTAAVVSVDRLERWNGERYESVSGRGE